MDEFDLLKHYFDVPARAVAGLSHLALGPGDDCAVLDLPSNHQLVVSVDTQVEGRHFPLGCPGDWVASRALGAAVSDLAAMGAEPVACLMALTLPSADKVWLESFSQRFQSLSAQWSIPLIGGDTTQGPLSVSVTVLGGVPQGLALTRSGAQPGDEVWVSGSPGEAAAGLAWVNETTDAGDCAFAERLLNRYVNPEPRLALGRWLRGKASAAIDVSDGLAADLSHICRASDVGVCLEIERLPLSGALRWSAGQAAQELLLSGGDDYELCFTASPALGSVLGAYDEPRLHCIGRVTASPGLWLSEGGVTRPMEASGYRHFNSGERIP